jgi:DNA-binding transcriptional ArsR family regulator
MSWERPARPDHSSEAADRVPPGFRELTDPRTMRALAHPTRLALLELMSREGSITVTRASEVLGESTASCSYHVRQLAKYGFVEPAGRGRGRERPWRRSSGGQSYTEVGMDPETAAAAETLTSIVVERHMQTVARWLGERRREPDDWRRVTGFSDRLFYLTPEELGDLDQRVFDLIDSTGYEDRTDDPAARPPGARAISLIVFGIPLPSPDQ